MAVMGIKDKGRFMMGIRNRFIYFAVRAGAGKRRTGIRGRRTGARRRRTGIRRRRHSRRPACEKHRRH